MTTPRRNSIDLHCHTARSDGVLEPLELHRQMRDWGSTLVAITDHDTLIGVRELLAAGLGADGASGPRILAGVEINTRADGASGRLGPRDGEELHVIGLGVHTDDARLEATLAQQRRRRQARLERTLERLSDLGLQVREHLPAVVGGIDALGRPHVARALVAAGYAISVGDAFDRYLGRGRPAYVAREGIGPRAAIEAIMAAGGIASLAHAPWAPDEPSVIDELMAWGLRGIEVHYHGWDEETVEAMARFAAGRGLLATGGSDYHGDTMSYAQAQATTYVPAAVGERLLAALDALPAR